MQAYETNLMFYSSRTPRRHISGFWIGIQTTQKFCNNSDGSTIKGALVTKVRRSPLSTWRNPSVPIRMMPKAGIFWGDATCLNKSIQKRMRPTSKLFIETEGIQPSGAPLVSSTTRSTSIAMLWTPIAVLSGLIHTSRRFGTISVHS